MLNAYRKTMLGEAGAVSQTFTPLTQSETVLLVVVGALIILGGVFPKPLMDLAAPSLEAITSKSF